MHRRSKKIKNSKRCLKFMELVEMSRFHAGRVSKKLTAFRTSNSIRCLQSGRSPKKFQRDAEYPAGLVVEMIVA